MHMKSGRNIDQYNFGRTILLCSLYPVIVILYLYGIVTAEKADCVLQNVVQKLLTCWNGENCSHEMVKIVPHCQCCKNCTYPAVCSANLIQSNIFLCKFKFSNCKVSNCNAITDKKGHLKRVGRGASGLGNLTVWGPAK